MAKSAAVEIDAIFEKCSKFFGEMQKMCDNYLKKNVKWKFSRKGLKNDRKTKPPKDPDAPKKPITAYILYFKDRKKDVVEQHQNLPITDVTKMIGREWKEMPKEKQLIYAERAKKDKERYIKELEAYNQKKAKEHSPDESPTDEVSQKNKKKLHKLSDIKPEPKREESDDEEEENEEAEEEEADDDEEAEEAEEDDDEEEADKESHNGKTKRGPFLATSSDNEFEEKIKKKIKK